tara:strand:+ start:287 stop:478 length:192 start_codon:yes stop_codon:yes gene_type:complete
MITCVECGHWTCLYSAMCLALLFVGRLDFPLFHYFAFLWAVLVVVCAPCVMLSLCARGIFLDF